MPSIWDQKYRSMPMAELLALVDRWRDITNEADRLAHVSGDPDDREHARACQDNLRIVSGIARERQTQAGRAGGLVD